jgi:RNA polymerase sigma-70 factor, ECF subfamily
MAAAYATGLVREKDDATIAAIEALHAQGRLPEAQEGYADIVRRHRQRASAIAHQYLGDPAEVDEVVQDTFVKAYVHLPSFRRELPFQAWFTRILTNGCRDRIKARRRREHWFTPVPPPLPGQRDFWDGVAGATLSPEDRVLARERRQTLIQAVGRLPGRQRSVITLCFWEGLSSLEVSALTGWKASTVRVHLFRGLRNLRRLLAEGAQQRFEKRP